MIAVGLPDGAPGGRWPPRPRPDHAAPVDPSRAGHPALSELGSQTPASNDKLRMATCGTARSVGLDADLDVDTVDMVRRYRTVPPSDGARQAPAPSRAGTGDG